MDDEDFELLHGDAKATAEYLGCTVRTVQLYKSGKLAMPIPIKKLLGIRHGDLAALMGAEWEGFCFGRDGKLYLPTYRNGFNPHQIRALFFNVQEVAALRNELRYIKS